MYQRTSHRMNARMYRLVFACLVLAVAAAPAAAQRARGSTAPRERRTPGMIDVERLRSEPITFELDVPYAGTDNPRQRLDVYAPKDRKAERLPAIVYIHGGGWMAGNKADGAGRLLPFVRGGEFVGISVDYRLSGEATWPAQIHDCKAALRWVYANAGKYGIDPDRIGVWGRSAGAHLALLLAFSPDVPELEGDLGPHVGSRGKLACAVNFFGVTDILAEIGQPSGIDRTKPDAPEARLIGGLLRDNEDKARAASPMTYLTPDDPPVLTIHGDRDRTVPYDQAIRLDAALGQAGVASYFVTVKGGGHANFGDVADERMRQFFAKHLQGKDVQVSTEQIEWRAPATR